MFKPYTVEQRISGDPGKRFYKDVCIDEDMGNVPKNSLNKALKIKQSEVFSVVKDKGLKDTHPSLSNIQLSANTTTVQYTPPFNGQQGSASGSGKQHLVTHHDSDGFIHGIHKEFFDHGDSVQRVPTAMIGTNNDLPKTDFNPVSQARGMHFVMEQTKQNDMLAREARKKFVKSISDNKPLRGHPQDGSGTKQLDHRKQFKR